MDTDVFPLRIAWLGVHPLGRAVAALSPGTAFVDVRPGRVLGWDDVTAAAGFAPDLLVYADQSLPPPLPDVADFPCRTLFYCVDSHIHGWYPAYAAAFDLCAVSLKDHLPRFERLMGPERVLWLPPMPRPEDAPLPGEPEWDLLFVGKDDPALTPGRHAFLKELKALLPGLEVRQGPYRELYPRARLVLNVAEAGDLNFRVFEALACAACLLTPDVGHGQEELLRRGEHLFTYPAMDATACAAQARALLADPALRGRVAQAGCREVQARHTAAARAQTLLDWVATAPAPESGPGSGPASGQELGHGPGSGPGARLDQAAARALRAVLLHWAQALAPDPMAQTMLRAATRLRASGPPRTPGPAHASGPESRPVAHTRVHETDWPGIGAPTDGAPGDCAPRDGTPRGGAPGGDAPPRDAS